LETAETAILAATLDGLGAGLFLVDVTGRIVHANLSGHAILQERAVLRAAAGTLVACDANAARTLKKILAMAAAGVGLSSGAIAVPLSTGEGETYVLHVLTLGMGARRRVGATCAAVAALFVHKAGLEGSPAHDAIARLYNLTSSETRVLLAIFEVGGVRETAQALGIAEATVKTHLHRLFGKTGTTRQADLVKLVASFSNPLLNRSSFPPRAERCHPTRRRAVVPALRLATEHGCSAVQSADQ
jgi:DNA-binding CsgD family transcriptional regulator